MSFKNHACCSGTCPGLAGPRLARPKQTRLQTSPGPSRQSTSHLTSQYGRALLILDHGGTVGLRGGRSRFATILQAALSGHISATISSAEVWESSVRALKLKRCRQSCAEVKATCEASIRDLSIKLLHAVARHSARSPLPMRHAGSSACVACTSPVSLQSRRISTAIGYSSRKTSWLCNKAMPGCRPLHGARVSLCTAPLNTIFTECHFYREMSLNTDIYLESATMTQSCGH